jgi:hypothetical protein
VADDREVVGKGFKIIFRGGTVSKKIAEVVTEGLKDAGQKYFAAVIENISLTDHDLQDMRELGYPYAVHGAGPPIHNDDAWVHMQSGSLLDSMKLTPVIAETSRTFSIHVVSDSPYVKYLLDGTSKMRPRRFDVKAWNDVGKEHVFDGMVGKLKGINYRIEK